MREKTFTTFDIAKILEVYPSTVARWINDGELKAFCTPGGHRRVIDTDLKIFLKNHNMPVPKALADADKKRILIVDDDKDLCAFVKRVLSAKGYEIVISQDGFQAGQALADQPVDVMLLDIMLPGIDGFKVCTMTKKRYPGIKIAALSGYATDENRQKMTEAGADAFLAKPFDPDDLLGAVESLLKRK